MSDLALAFACTLERKERVASKFAKDVKTIVESGDRFDHVYAMCAVAVDVGRRNRLRNNSTQRRPTGGPETTSKARF